jgi:hypothetical protein
MSRKAIIIIQSSSLNNRASLDLVHKESSDSIQGLIVSYKLNFQYESGILLVSISGERQKDELVSSAKEVWRKIARMGHEKGYGKLLIVSSATGNYPVLDAFLINSSLDECGVQRVWKIAFVNLDQASFPDVKFAETVAVNRGFDLGVFDNETDARSWLLAS